MTIYSFRGYVGEMLGGDEGFKPKNPLLCAERERDRESNSETLSMIHVLFVSSSRLDWTSGRSPFVQHRYINPRNNGYYTRPISHDRYYNRSDSKLSVYDPLAKSPIPPPLMMITRFLP